MSELGVVLCDGEVLDQTPSKDNRCYVLTRDLELRDTGRSADWFLWLFSPSSGDPQHTGGIYSQTDLFRDEEAKFWPAIAESASQDFVQVQVMLLCRAMQEGVVKFDHGDVSLSAPPMVTEFLPRP